MKELYQTSIQIKELAPEIHKTMHATGVTDPPLPHPLYKFWACSALPVMFKHQSTLGGWCGQYNISSPYVHEIILSLNFHYKTKQYLGKGVDKGVGCGMCGVG